MADEEIVNEVEEAGRLRSDMQTAILALEKVDAGRKTTAESQGESASTLQCDIQQSYSTKDNGRKIYAKLPELEIRNFNGRAEDWQAFWDCLRKQH